MTNYIPKFRKEKKIWQTQGLSQYRYNKHLNKYNNAIDVLEHKRYAEAFDEFNELKSFKGSEKYSEYIGAILSMQDKEYEQAKETFTELGSFEDAENLIKECEEEIERADIYQQANDLYNKGDYEGALKLFNQLPLIYEDSVSLSHSCSGKICQKKVEEKISEQDYEGALALLKSGDGMYVDGRSDLLKQCNDPLDYAKAEEAYNNGLFYTAYQMFEELGSYSDSAERAASCAQPMPKTGEVYRNPDYSKKGITVNFKAVTNTKYSELHRFYKIYKIVDDEEVYVSGVYVAPGKQGSVSLSAGRYVFKVACLNHVLLNKVDPDGDGEYNFDLEESGDNRFDNFFYEYGLQEEVQWVRRRGFRSRCKLHQARAQRRRV